ncbi:hypothetical protein WJX72_009726 [[Myrmecia] bisecta]|uniref:EGF-like domain-containing protein n=1 Tax=[Myrmecia] bisecta TaxID=41462 RepID=A0AAW1QSW4_9CHLO
MATFPSLPAALLLLLMLNVASAGILPLRRSLGDTTSCLPNDPYCTICTADGGACAQCVPGASVPNGGTNCQGTPIFNGDTGNGAFPPNQGWKGLKWTTGNGYCGGSPFCGNGLAAQGSNVMVFSDFKSPLIAALNGTFDLTHIALGQGSSCYPDITFTAIKAGASQGSFVVSAGCGTNAAFPSAFMGIDAVGMSFSGGHWVINQISLVFHYDINPCNSGYCADAKAICTYGGISNTATCTCPTDYTMSGSANTTTCTASNPCTTAPPSTGAYCGSDPQVTCSSPAPFNATCSCNAGYYVSSGTGSATVCSPIDVCTQGGAPFCNDPVATCTSTGPGTGACSCPNGRTASGSGANTLCLGRPAFNGDTGNGVFPTAQGYSGLAWTYGSGSSFSGNGLAGSTSRVEVFSDFKTPLFRALNGTINVTHIQLSQNLNCYSAITFTGQRSGATKGTVTIPAGCATLFAFPVSFQGIDSLQMSFSTARWYINQIWFQTNYDVNPCLTGRPCGSDSNVVCTYGGTSGTNTCSCNAGYYISSGSGTSTVCSPTNPSINLCANATPYCGTDARVVCTNTGPGTATCTCNDPANYYMTGSGSSSKCNPNNPCPGFCGSDSRVVCTYANSPGSATCTCPSGYTASGSTPNVICQGRAVFNNDCGGGVFPPSQGYSGLTWTYGSGTSFGGNGLAGYTSKVQVFNDFKNPLFRSPTGGVFTVTSISLTSTPYNYCWPDVTFTAYKAGVSQGTGSCWISAAGTGAWIWVHQNPYRYVRHLTSQWGSGAITALRFPLVLVALAACLVCSYQSALAADRLPAGFPSLAIVSHEPFNLSSFALSLLLVFRTNASYARWNEGRTAWGAVLNTSRRFARQGLSWFDPADLALLNMLERWTIALSVSLLVQLRPDGNLEDALSAILLPDELRALKAVQHRPIYVLRVLQELTCRAVSPYLQARMDMTLAEFEDACGTCERLHNSPLPLLYTRHTSRFLCVAVACLPFMLWADCGWGTVPASVAIAYLLMGIDTIGVLIEQPFDILPLESIAGTAERNIRELFAARAQCRSLVNDGAGPTRAA